MYARAGECVYLYLCFFLLALTFSFNQKCTNSLHIFIINEYLQLKETIHNPGPAPSLNPSDLEIPVSVCVYIYDVKLPNLTSNGLQ